MTPERETEDWQGDVEPAEVGKGCLLPEREDPPERGGEEDDAD